MCQYGHPWKRGSLYDVHVSVGPASASLGMKEYTRVVPGDGVGRACVLGEFPL